MGAGYVASSRSVRMHTMSRACQHILGTPCYLATVVEREDEALLRIVLQDRRYDDEYRDCLNHALQAAALGGFHGMAQLLVARGADTNFRGGDWETPLQAAIIGDQVDMVSWLLRCGARMDLETEMLCTPLQGAAALGAKDIVFTLLKKGANVNQQAGIYRTALQIASLEGNAAIVQILLDHGADVNVAGGVHGSALGAAASIQGMTAPTGEVGKVRQEEDFTWLRQHTMQGRNTRLAQYLEVVDLLLNASRKAILKQMETPLS